MRQQHCTEYTQSVSMSIEKTKRVCSYLVLSPKTGRVSMCLDKYFPFEYVSKSGSCYTKKKKFEN